MPHDKNPKYLGFIVDPEFHCNRHIDSLVNRIRRRLNILKYIAGRDWGADSATLRTTYTALVRPILEYDFQVYSCASASILQKLEKVQLSAARIISGLRNSCQSHILLYETNFQSLEMRRESNLVKHYAKLASLGTQNRTAEFLLNWQNYQRLKKDSPLSRALSLDAVKFNVDPQLICSPVTKGNHPPEYLKQLALGLINLVPADDLKIYTDGSGDDHHHAGSGIYTIYPAEVHESRSLRNPDFCSVFRIAIQTGLENIRTGATFGNVWIFTDSRSCIQLLSNWERVTDRTGVSIRRSLNALSDFHDIHIQWIPSHVGLIGNERADQLAKEGTSLPATPNTALTYSELFSIRKSKVNKAWLVPPDHNWYARKRPGGALDLLGTRADQTATCRFARTY
ncbi:uncharacterized protein [Parasteatoda tepidariorum]|uniref:uncharacterized protein n=1 Tax=Parasteatoda tepidariorum TaxID=114398 RepID=UPI001C71D072|nr:uncharacterized protein LOC122270961 [Parasteatoda tepidariorum]